MLPATLELRFPNRLDDLAGIVLELRRFIGARAVGPRPAYVANLVLEELATNTIKYGYDDTAVHEILVRITVDSDKLTVVFEDDGHPFNPLELPEPDLSSGLEDREPGGLGIYLVRKLADHMDYQRRDGRNYVAVDIPLDREC